MYGVKVINSITFGLGQAYFHVRNIIYIPSSAVITIPDLCFAKFWQYRFKLSVMSFVNNNTTTFHYSNAIKWLPFKVGLWGWNVCNLTLVICLFVLIKRLFPIDYIICNFKSHSLNIVKMLTTHHLSEDTSQCQKLAPPRLLSRQALGLSDVRNLNLEKNRLLPIDPQQQTSLQRHINK